VLQSGDLVRALRALLLYTGMTVAFTWPLPALLRTVDAGDAAFFAWEVGWEAHALRTAPGQLPHANIFHPLRYTLGLDEPVLGTTLLVLPLVPFTDDGVLLFNLARLLTFPLSALSAYLLARSLRCGEAASLLAGAAFAFSPIRTDQLAHLSTLGTQWLPLAVLFLHRFANSARAADAALAGLFYALATLACGYHGLIGLAVLPPAALVLLWGRWRRLTVGLVGVAVAAAGVLPLYLLHRAALQPFGFARGAQETVLYAAGLETFLAASARNHVWGDATAAFRGSANDLFPGVVLPALVLLGALHLWRSRRRPGRDAIALAVMLAAGVVVALGPEVRLFGRALFPGPFALVREIPLFQMIRVTSRAGVYIALPLAVLAAKALDALAPRAAARAIVMGLALAETVIAPIEVPAWARAVDTRQPVPAVYEWLAAQPGAPPVVELPILDPGAVFSRPAHHESVYMVHSLRHWKPLVNGYAGLEPPHYVRARELSRQFPAEPFLASLRELGVRYVVLHRGGYGPNRWARIERDLQAAPPGLQEVARFGGDRVFELH
jgi:hypothetical protein